MVWLFNIENVVVNELFVYVTNEDKLNAWLCIGARCDANVLLVEVVKDPKLVEFVSVKFNWGVRVELIFDT